MYYEIDERRIVVDEEDGYSSFDEATEAAVRRFDERMEEAECERCDLEDQLEELDEEIGDLRKQLALLERVRTWEEYLDGIKDGEGRIAEPLLVKGEEQ